MATDTRKYNNKHPAIRPVNRVFIPNVCARFSYENCNKRKYSKVNVILFKHTVFWQYCTRDSIATVQYKSPFACNNLRNVSNAHFLDHRS